MSAVLNKGIGQHVKLALLGSWFTKILRDKLNTWRQEKYLETSKCTNFIHKTNSFIMRVY